MRLLKWTLLCGRGKRCARISLVDAHMPPGATFKFGWRCSTCGTEYIWDGEQRRATRDEVAARPAETITLVPGQEATILMHRGDDE